MVRFGSCPIKGLTKRQKRSALDRGSDALHEAGKIPKIVDRVQPGPEHFFHIEEMMQIRAGVPPADRAPAITVDGPLVTPVLRLLDAHPTAAREQRPGSPVARGHDAVKEVD